MKIIMIITIIAILAIGVVLLIKSNTEPKEVFYPEPTGYVVDSAEIISPTFEELITVLIKDVSTHEIAVVTVESTKPLGINEYSIKLAEKFKVGDEEKDDGIIFLIASEDRKVRIEVGYGLEGVLNDAKAGRLLDEYVIPHLKNDDWEEGILVGVREIIKITK